MVTYGPDDGLTRVQAAAHLPGGAQQEEEGAVGLGMGLRLARHCIEVHTTVGGGDQSQRFAAGAMWEFVDDDDGVYTAPDGTVPSDRAYRRAAAANLCCAVPRGCQHIADIFHCLAGG